MREHYINSCELPDEEGGQRLFDYYLLIDELDVGRFLCESYGVRVVQRGTDYQCTVPHVTTSAARIDSLLERLIRGRVTPCTVDDIIEDWL